MLRKTEGIYFTHVPPGGSRRLVGYCARVNGRPAIAFKKDGKVMGYILLEEFMRQALSGPCENITIPEQR